MISDIALCNHHLRVRSRRASRACLIGAIAMPVAVLATLLSGGGLPGIFGGAMGLSLSYAPSTLALGLAALAAMASVLYSAGALLAAQRLLLHVADGQWFDIRSGKAIRAMGAWGMTGAGLGSLAPTPVGILTIGAGPGQKSLVISVGSGPLPGLIFGMVLYLIGDVMKRAAALARHHVAIV